MLRRRTRSPSGLRPLEVEDAMASFAADHLSPLELLKERRTDASAAGVAGIVDHARHAHLLPLFENLVELALQPLGYFLLDAGNTLLQLLDFRAQIAERVLPGVVGGVPARFQIGAARLDAFEISLQCFDLAHVFER